MLNETPAQTFARLERARRAWLRAETEWNGVETVKSALTWYVVRPSDQRLPSFKSLCHAAAVEKRAEYVYTHAVACIGVQPYIAAHYMRDAVTGRTPLAAIERAHLAHLSEAAEVAAMNAASDADTEAMIEWLA